MKKEAEGRIEPVWAEESGRPAEDGPPAASEALAGAAGPAWLPAAPRLDALLRWWSETDSRDGFEFRP